jgi:hypothetical protein
MAEQVTQTLIAFGDRAVGPVVSSLQQVQRTKSQANAVNYGIRVSKHVRILARLRAVDPLIDILRTEDDSSALNDCVEGLGQIEDDRAIAALKAASSHPYRAVRMKVEEVLGRTDRRTVEDQPVNECSTDSGVCLDPRMLLPRFASPEMTPQKVIHGLVEGAANDRNIAYDLQRFLEHGGGRLAAIDDLQRLSGGHVDERQPEGLPWERLRQLARREWILRDEAGRESDATSEDAPDSSLPAKDRTVRCACGAAYAIKPQYRGHKVRCKKCNRVFQVPVA